MEEKVKDEEALKKHADEILATFEGKHYDGQQVLAVAGYVLAIMFGEIAEQNSKQDALFLFNHLSDLVVNSIFFDDKQQ